MEGKGNYSSACSPNQDVEVIITVTGVIGGNYFQIYSIKKKDENAYVQLPLRATPLLMEVVLPLMGMDVVQVLNYSFTD